MKLLSSELLKLRTIRTSYLLLLGSAAISAIAAAGFVGSGNVDRGDQDPALALGQGASFGTLFVAVLGILIVTNEYRHGPIMTTFLSEPRRVRVLLAKLAAAAIVGYFVWIFVIESLVSVLSGLLFTDIGDPDPVSKFLPGSSLSGIVGGEGNEFVLRGGAAAVLAIGYAIGLSVLGALSMTRRDP